MLESHTLGGGHTPVFPVCCVLQGPTGWAFDGLLCQPETQEKVPDPLLNHSCTEIARCKSSAFFNAWGGGRGGIEHELSDVLWVQYSLRFSSLSGTHSTVNSP